MNGAREINCFRASMAYQSPIQKILHAHNPAATPWGVDFNYVQAFQGLDLNAAIPLDSLAYKFDIVLRGRRSTLFENRLEGN